MSTRCIDDKKEKLSASIPIDLASGFFNVRKSVKGRFRATGFVCKGQIFVIKDLNNELSFAFLSVISKTILYVGILTKELSVSKGWLEEGGGGCRGNKCWFKIFLRRNFASNERDWLIGTNLTRESGKTTCREKIACVTEKTHHIRHRTNPRHSSTEQTHDIRVYGLCDGAILLSCDV